MGGDRIPFKITHLFWIGLDKRSSKFWLLKSRKTQIVQVVKDKISNLALILNNCIVINIEGFVNIVSSSHPMVSPLPPSLITQSQVNCHALPPNIPIWELVNPTFSTRNYWMTVLTLI